MKRTLRKVVLLLVLSVTPLIRAADRDERVRSLSPNFICICNCNQLLSACNHFHCPSSGPMMAELTKLIDAGKTDEEIIAHFENKFGTSVLAAPPARGFNLVAWIVPFVALGLGGAAAIFFLRRFRASWAGAPSPTADLTKYQDKVEEELKKFSPED